jgi:hypothetical protein
MQQFQSRTTIVIQFSAHPPTIALGHGTETSLGLIDFAEHDTSRHNILNEGLTVALGVSALASDGLGAGQR